MATCVYCSAEFTPPRPDTPFCRDCWYSGRALEDDYRGLLGDLREIPGVTASIMHSGGNCFGLAVTVPSGRFIFGTACYRDKHGVWQTDAGLPNRENGDLWTLATYKSEDHFGDAAPEHVVRVFYPADTAEVIQYVRDDKRADTDADAIAWHAIAAIAVDIDNGTVPKDVRTFEELHAYVDANMYYGITLADEEDEPGLLQAQTDACNAAAVIVDTWLRSRGW